MQRTGQIDVLTTQLAATDRRTLSQAWYSALHLAEHPPRGTISNERCAGTMRSAERSRVPSAPTPARVTADPTRTAANAPRAATRRDNAELVVVERRAAKSQLTRRLERALAQRAQREWPSSFALRTADGRIHLMIRNDGTRTRLVAICAPSLRERVERALAQARFALAGHGVMPEVA